MVHQGFLFVRRLVCKEGTISQAGAKFAGFWIIEGRKIVGGFVQNESFIWNFVRIRALYIFELVVIYINGPAEGTGVVCRW